MTINQLKQLFSEYRIPYFRRKCNRRLTVYISQQISDIFNKQFHINYKLFKNIDNKNIIIILDNQYQIKAKYYFIIKNYNYGVTKQIYDRYYVQSNIYYIFPVNNKYVILITNDKLIIIDLNKDNIGYLKILLSTSYIEKLNHNNVYQYIFTYLKDNNIEIKLDFDKLIELQDKIDIAVNFLQSQLFLEKMIKCAE